MQDNKDIALSIKGLYKDFVLPVDKSTSIKEHVLKFKKQENVKFKVLNDINIEVKRGEFFGIVGRNGSGKSTLLKLIGGIYQPTRGEVHVNGTLTPFIELGIGFNPELTGRENVFLNGAILGLTRRQISKIYDEIVEFAELEKFMDQKLKNYSSGMQVRLAFSISIRAHNDILLIDEVLAVGDAAFQRKCFEVFKDIKRQRKTVIFVTHDMGAVQEYCDRAMLINDGVVVKTGRSDEIASLYTELNYKSLKNEEVVEANDDKYTKAQIVKVYSKNGSSKSSRFKVGESISINFEAKFKETIQDLVAGVTVKDMTGRPVFATNTQVAKIKLPNYQKNDKVGFEFLFSNPLNEGTYIVEPAIADSVTKEVYDSRVEGCRFSVTNSDFPFGIVYPTAKINYKKVP